MFELSHTQTLGVPPYRREELIYLMAHTLSFTFPESLNFEKKGNRLAAIR
jgi:hypothetical protein